MSRRGFTLLEIIVALAIVALVMAVIAPAMFSAFRAEQQARRSLEPLAQTQVACDLLRTDLLALQVATGTGEVPFALGTTAVAGQAVTSLTGTIRLVPPLPPGIAVSTPDAGQAVVTWTLQAADDGRGLALTRSSQVNLLATGTVPTPIPEVVLDHLATLTLEVFSNGSFTTSYASADNGGALPAGLRLSYRLLNDDDTPGPLRVLVFDLPAVALGGA
jgi:prepilin-type N-terminal cleavage/methylation domain-containing protein